MPYLPKQSRLEIFKVCSCLAHGRNDKNSPLEGQDFSFVFATNQDPANIFGHASITSGSLNPQLFGTLLSVLG